MGPDWNGDGKHDVYDDAFYIDEINSGKDKPPVKPPSEINWRFAVNIVAIGYLGLLVTGDIAINQFTTGIGVICAVWLLISLLRRLF